MAGTVFISYRRADSAAWAGRIADKIEAGLPDLKVVIDVASIEPGSNFVEVIRQSVAASNITLAVIGRDWLTCTDADGNRRIDDPQDLVRLEISSALRDGKRVVPLLVDDARMPLEAELPDDLRALAFRNAVQIRHASFRPDTDLLCAFIEKFFAEPVDDDAEGSEPPEADEAVCTAMIADFTTWLAAPPDSYIILESASGQFVQFLRDDAFAILDLPTHPLSANQVSAAHRLVLDEWKGVQHMLDERNFSVQAHFDAEPDMLCSVVLTVFDRVYGAVPTAPLKATIER